MAGALYVGNLSFKTTEETLRQAFEQGGRKVVDVKLVVDRDTGQPRGFGFVEMASVADAQVAIGASDGQQMDGRTLKVSVAQERSGGAEAAVAAVVAAAVATAAVATNCDDVTRKTVDNGGIARRERLGGLLNYYHREAA